MLAETIAQASAPSDEDDYQAFCQTLSESERGRAFLAEYAAEPERRHRAIAGGDRAAAISHGRAADGAQPRLGHTSCVSFSTKSAMPSASSTNFS